MDRKYALYKQPLLLTFTRTLSHPAVFRGRTNAENLTCKVRDLRWTQVRLRPEFQIKINLYASEKQQLSEVCKEARGNEVPK